MKISLNWLQEFVAIEMDIAELCQRLTMAGLEVEAVRQLDEDIRSVVVGEIAAMRPHPSAERLTLCEVVVGAGEAVVVVCGAKNMKVGDRVAFAAPGTTLPGGRRIEAAEIRGVSSNGMLCSEQELGVGTDAEGILILDKSAVVGAPVAKALGLDDTVLDISVTPNRGDCLSVLGIARELAALTGARLLRPHVRLREVGEAAGKTVTVRTDDPAGCARYGARLVRNVRPGQSPRWMQQRLRAAGLRPISNIVDVTNYVMIERGHPLHAFDFNRLPEPEITVRRAGSISSIETLDGVIRELVPEDLLITSGGVAVAIAGVMGAANTQVRADTRTVLLEAAWFAPESVRRTARRLDLHSEAAYRFERGADIAAIPAVLDRAASLLAELCGGQVAPGIVDAYPSPRPVPPIYVRLKRVEDVLGVTMARSTATSVLKALGANVSPGPRGALSVEPPSYRVDLVREIDVIEEIARIIGYEQIPGTMPAFAPQGAAIPERMRWTRELRRVLAALGLSETVGLSFTSVRLNEIFPGLETHGRPLVILNPVRREEPEMRRSLLASFVPMWQLNRSQGAASIALFSVGKVFWVDDSGLPCEGWRLGALLAGDRPNLGLGSPDVVEFQHAKGVVEALLDRLHLASHAVWEPCAEVASFHPGKTARIRINDEEVGILGALHPDVELELDVNGANWLFELDVEKVLAHVSSQLRYQELPRFPSVVRDLAMVVDRDFASESVNSFIRQWSHSLIEGSRLFDEYTGPPIPEGKKSLAYSISYRAPDRTLTDEEVNAVHGALREALSKAFDIVLRS